MSVWKQIGFIRSGGFWLLICFFGAKWPLPLTLRAVLSQVCECNPCQQLHCIYIFLFILGTCTVKDFSSPCCNAACQFGSLVYPGARPLPFLTRSNALFWHVCQQVWSGVKKHVAQKWRSCHIGWTSRSRDGTSRGIAPAAPYTARWHPCPRENRFTSEEVAFMSVGECSCFDPGVAVPPLR